MQDEHTISSLTVTWITAFRETMSAHGFLSTSCNLNVITGNGMTHVDQGRALPLSSSDHWSPRVT